jgi:RNA polymerase sigma factor (sigma-70 family)
MPDMGVAGNGFSKTTRDTASVHEGALMERVAMQRMDAFETLYRLYHPRLLRFIERMTRRASLVDEVIDDTMLVVWRKAGTYRPEVKVSTWIFAIAYRQTLKALRKVEPAVEFEVDTKAEAGRHGPESTVQREELRTHLRQALGELSAEQRAVIEMTYYLGYSCAEIARIMDCPVDTVKTRMFYARRRLKGLLDLSWEEAM